MRSLPRTDGRDGCDGREGPTIEGQEAHARMDRLTRKYLGSERYEGMLPREQRVAVIVRPLKVRHLVGVERFRLGGPSRHPETG